MERKKQTARKPFEIKNNILTVNQLVDKLQEQYNGRSKEDIDKMLKEKYGLTKVVKKDYIMALEKLQCEKEKEKKKEKKEVIKYVEKEENVSYINLINQAVKKLNNDICDIDINKIVAVVEHLCKNTEKIDKEYSNTPITPPCLDFNTCSIFVNQGDVNLLHKLSLVNKELVAWLSNEENMKTLIHVTEIKRYYNEHDINDFNTLHYLYSTIKVREDIYNAIKSEFDEYYYERAIDFNNELIGEYTTYEAFMQYQHDFLFSVKMDHKKLQFLKYVTDVGGFMMVDKEDMIEMRNDGIMFSGNGNICFTIGR